MDVTGRTAVAAGVGAAAGVGIELLRQRRQEGPTRYGSVVAAGVTGFAVGIGAEQWGSKMHANSLFEQRVRAAGDLR
jgi:hypothetical protein